MVIVTDSINKIPDSSFNYDRSIRVGSLVKTNLHGLSLTVYEVIDIDPRLPDTTNPFHHEASGNPLVTVVAVANYRKRTTKVYDIKWLVKVVDVGFEGNYGDGI